MNNDELMIQHQESDMPINPSNTLSNSVTTSAPIREALSGYFQ